MYRNHRTKGRWTRIGTAIGDTIQRDLLLAEKDTSAILFSGLRRNEDGTPMFEEFAKKARNIMHKGKVFALYGTCDGIMLYTSDDGDVRTSRTRDKIEADNILADITLLYAGAERRSHQAGDMLLHYVQRRLLHHSLRQRLKKGWNMSEERITQKAQTSGHLGFTLPTSTAMRSDVLDTFAGVPEQMGKGIPPALDIEKWTFNNYKESLCLIAVRRRSRRYQRVSQTVCSAVAYRTEKKSVYRECVEYITTIRSEVTEADKKENSKLIAILV
ncbi:hypothetical protein [Paenibacillus larvae]|uniref:hypothetical protein n=1 Tax=Paenibacillus larvae TaxID=1464 RepID=UPI00288DAF7D|nr:hypothetical protein [Paenibacillus larvae]MDT2278138.1 hypothetical protein [Paenibacillus larvae]